MKAKKLMSVILSLCMVLSVIQVTSIAAFAGEEVSYLYPVYNKTDGTFYENCSSGIKEWKSGNCTSYAAVTSDDTTWGTAGTESWYVASGKVEIDSSVAINGDVRLILLDDANLTIKGSTGAGIDNYGEGNSFIVYAQSTGSAMGKLTVTGFGSGYQCYAGIRSGGGATVTINGGDVTAYGAISNGYCGAGIGGNWDENGSNITVNGGKVTADNAGEGALAAGIGGGSDGNGEYITINGGTVIAGNENVMAAGIGGGVNNYAKTTHKGSGSHITINGGDVTAKSKDGAGIGSGQYGFTASYITITGGTVDAMGNVGIGGSANLNYGDNFTSAHDITINGGTVTAATTNKCQGAAIGGLGCTKESGQYDEDGNLLATAVPAKVYNITISGSNTVVTAKANGPGAGIGGGVFCSAENITIEDGATVIATGGRFAAGIGGGGDATVTNNEVGNFSNADNITISGEGTTVTTTGGNYGAGIGAGAYGNATNITVTNGAKVYADTSNGCAIGAGSRGSADKITISDSAEVVAVVPSDYVAAIGSAKGNASNITIDNATVTAKSMNSGTAIGSANGEATNIVIKGEDTFVTSVADSGSAIGAGQNGSATNIYVDPSLLMVQNDDETLTDDMEICRNRTMDEDVSATVCNKKMNVIVIKPRDAYVAQVGEGDTAVKYLFVQTAIDKAIEDLSYIRKEGNYYYIDDPSSANIEVNKCTNLENVTITMIANSSEEIDIPSIRVGIYSEEYFGMCSSDFGEFAYLGQNITLNLNGHTLSGFFDCGESVVSIGENQTLTVNGGCITGASAEKYGLGSKVICCGVYNDGTFNMTSGTITGNNVDGGVYNNGTMTVGGTAVIEGNTLNGETVQNLYLTSGKKVVISSETPFVEGANIGVTTATKPTDGSPVEFATSATKNDETNDEDYFFSDSLEYADKYYYAGTALDLILGNRVTALESENGSVSVGNQKSAYDGEKVKVKATPDDGYALNEVTIKKAEDSTDITEAVGYDETTGTFTMPAYEVTVSATFKEDENPCTNAAYSASLSLSSNVAINFSMKNFAEGFESDKLSITVDGKEVSAKYDASKGVISAAIATVSPAEMDKVFEICVSYGDKTVKQFNFSVRAYCDAVFELDDKDQALATPTGKFTNLADLCESLLNYGKYAIDYVNEVGNTGKAASDLNSGHVIDFSQVTVSAESPIEEGTTVVPTNAQLIINSDSTITMNYYVTSSKALTAKNVTIKNADDENVVSSDISVSKDSTVTNGYIISLKNVGASRFSRTYTLTSSVDEDFSYTYSVYNYCDDVQDQTDEEFTDTLKTLCKSIYSFGEAAKTYVDASKK